MLKLNAEQYASCKISTCGYSVTITVEQIVGNGIVYTMDGATFVLCWPNGKQQWHWWYNPDEGSAGVSRKVGVCLRDWDNERMSIEVCADGCDITQH